MGTRKKSRSDVARVGAVGELMFAAEARSRGCIVFLPVGGDSTPSVDLVVLTPTGRKLTVQVKTQATRKFHTTTVRKRGGVREVADITAVFHDTWHLVPRRAIGSQSFTLNVNQARKYCERWSLLR